MLLPALLRALAGDAPAAALRRADRLATELLDLLRDVREDTGEIARIGERLDAVDRRLAGVERHVASLDTSIPSVAEDVGALRSEAEQLRELLPGQGDPGPLEQAKRVVTGG